MYIRTEKKTTMTKSNLHIHSKTQRQWFQRSISNLESQHFEGIHATQKNSILRNFALKIGPRKYVVNCSFHGQQLDCFMVRLLE